MSIIVHNLVRFLIPFVAIFGCSVAIAILLGKRRTLSNRMSIRRTTRQDSSTGGEAQQQYSILAVLLVINIAFLVTMGPFGIFMYDGV